jgi:pyruvate-formate lyase-activating enzyme
MKCLWCHNFSLLSRQIAKIMAFTRAELTLRQVAVVHLMDLRQHLPENKRNRIKQTLLKKTEES